MQLSDTERQHLTAILAQYDQHPEVQRMREFIQHGDVTVFDHCIAVAEYSCRIAEFLHLSVNRKVLIRGALLHDYFLYDWHNPDNGHRLHGFSHPYTSLKNAKRDYSITKREADIIVKHMFPLTIVPPQTKEAWIVCLADKICAGEETIKGIRKRKRRKSR